MNSTNNLKNKEEKKAQSLGSTAQISQDRDGPTNELETYYEWHSIDPNGPIFTPRTGHTVANIGQKAFLFGGFDLDKKTNDLFEFDLKNFNWKLLQPKGQAPAARSGSKSVVSKGILYYFGGYVSKDGEYFNDLHAFNPAENEWKHLHIKGDPITPRVDHTMIVFGNALYIFAGTNQKTILNDLYKINPETLKCKKIKSTGDIPTLRFGHTSDTYKNSMYVFGGWNGYETLGEFFTYSFISNIWYEEKLVSGSKPPSRYRHASAVVGNSLFIFGGVDKTQVKYNDLYEFNFDCREWRYIDTTGLTPTPRTFHQLISYENKLYLFGGSDTQKRNDVYFILTNSDSSKDEVTTEVSDVSHMLFFDSENKIKFIEENNQSEDKAYKIAKVLSQQVDELKHRLKCEQDRYTCAGCQEKEINAVFLNCGHRCMCYNCAVRNSKCPICNQDVARVVKVFTI